MDEKRVFLALPLEPADLVAEKMVLLQKKLRPYRIKWVDTHNFHLTLFFFGEIPVQQIPVLKVLLHSTIKNFPAFSFSITEPGLFKAGKEPRVLWLGVKAPEQLFEMKRAIDEAVSTLGFWSENKIFSPHLTLGRFLPRQGISSVLDNALKEESMVEPIDYYASKLILFESRLNPSGPQYHPIEVFSLVQ
jgi:RNA 2',3'-cyclic 3'-phosphodiesterase